MTAMSVTAQQAGSTSNGLLLRVLVLTGAAAVQNGATAVQSAPAPHSATIVTTVTGSQVYAAVTCGSSGTALSPEASTTLYDNFQDTANGEYYGTGRTTSATGTPGSVVVGAHLPGGFGGGCALAEILPDGLITEDSSAPAVVTATAGTSVTTAVFDPPPGALLVALIGSDGGSGVTSMGVSGGGFTWAPLVEADATSDDYAGIWVAQLPPPDPFDPLIAATQGTSTAAGMILRVMVLTGARPAAQQTGGTASQSAAAAHTASVTTTIAGSRVYGAAINSAVTPLSAAALTSLIDNVTDSTHSECYGSLKATSVTGTPGATTLGVTNVQGGGVALLEILPAGTIAEDPSGPAVASTTAATTVSTSNIVAPAGSLMVALVSADGGAGAETMTVSGGGLNWAEKIAAHAAGFDYAGVWIADVPAGDPGSPPRLPNYLIIEIAASMALRLSADQPAAAVQGTAALAGTGSIAAAAIQLAPATLAGAGSVTAPATQLAPATLAAAGSLTTADVQGSAATLAAAGSLATAATQQAPVTLAGAGSLAAADVQQATATLAAAGSLAGKATGQAGATLAGTGSLTAAGTVTAPGAATLAAAGSLTAAAIQGAGATLAGTGSLAPVPATESARATLSAAGSLTAPAVQQAPAALAGTGSLTAAGTVTGSQAGAATLAAAGSLTAAATQLAPATLSGTGSISALSVTQAPAALNGTGSLTAPASTEQAPATLAGTGSLTAKATQLAPATLSGTGSLSAAAAELTGATLAGTGSLTATGTVTGSQSGAAALAGTGSLAAAAAQLAPATLAAAGSLAAAAAERAPATLNGAGSLAAAGAVLTAGAAALAGTGSLTAAGTFRVPALLNGTGSLSALALQRATALLAGMGSLTAAGAVGFAGPVNATSSPLVTAGATSAPSVTGKPGGTIYTTAYGGTYAPDPAPAATSRVTGPVHGPAVTGSGGSQAGVSQNASSAPGVSDG